MTRPSDRSKPRAGDEGSAFDPRSFFFNLFPNTMELKLETYNPLRADIEELKKLNASLVFDYESREGNMDARSHVFKLLCKKADIEHARKKLKDDALDFGKHVDAAAAELKEEIECMIKVHWDQIEAIEKKEREAARAKAEHEARERDDKARETAINVIEESIHESINFGLIDCRGEDSHVICESVARAIVAGKIARVKATI